MLWLYTEFQCSTMPETGQQICGGVGGMGVWAYFSVILAEHFNPPEEIVLNEKIQNHCKLLTKEHKWMKLKVQLRVQTDFVTSSSWATYTCNKVWNVWFWSTKNVLEIHLVACELYIDYGGKSRMICDMFKSRPIYWC